MSLHTWEELCRAVAGTCTKCGQDTLVIHPYPFPKGTAVCPCSTPAEMIAFVEWASDRLRTNGAPGALPTKGPSPMKTPPQEAPPTVGALVMIHHGARTGAPRDGQVARVEVVGASLVEVRKFMPTSTSKTGETGAFARHTMKLPFSMILGPAPEDDPRTLAARTAEEAPPKLPRPLPPKKSRGRKANLNP